jgi:VDE lipocalin domain
MIRRAAVVAVAMILVADVAAAAAASRRETTATTAFVARTSSSTHRRVKTTSSTPSVVAAAGVDAPVIVRKPWEWSSSSSRSKLAAITVAEETVTTATSTATTTTSTLSSVGKLLFLLPHNGDSIPSKFGSASPVEHPPSLLEAARHLAQKAHYFADGMLESKILTTVPLPGVDRTSDAETTISHELRTAEIVIAYGLQTAEELRYAKRIFQERHRQDSSIRNRLLSFAVDCATAGATATADTDGDAFAPIPALVGPYDASDPSILLLATLVPWSPRATARRMHEQMQDLFHRWTSDDFCYACMLFLNQFSGSPIEWVRYRTVASWEKGALQNAKELYSMIDQCSDCIVPCIQDEACRTCLTKLTALDPRDQAASYRTLVSYESDLLTKFSLCIFTKKNIFQCNATIPTLPRVPPMAEWRGRPVTEDAARALLVAHLDDEAAPVGSLRLPVSWKVACGANVAYDQFPSQNQIFYPAAAARGRDMWYDPVFRVVTLDGRNVWCKRHYKVRPQPVPATFRFSVLDNGVTSDEFWTIVGAADDLSWIVFHYAGAAKAVGLRYLGGLLCTPDGALPEPSKLPEIWKCFQSAGIQPWELYMVDNDDDAPGHIDAGPPPLEFYRKAVSERNSASKSATK